MSSSSNPFITTLDMEKVSVDIGVTNNQERFFTGETVAGTVLVNLPPEIPLSSVAISYNCQGEVKWVEFPETPHYHDGHVYYDQKVYHKEVYPFKESDVTMVPHSDYVKFCIPYSFQIPKSLPSTMVGEHGFVQHTIKITIDNAEDNFVKEITVFSPMEKNLMLTVGGGADKVVFLKGGKVLMYATIWRKGFAPGETIKVHVVVDNKTSTSITPRITLHQVQIYMHTLRHKTIESTVSEEPIVGTEIEPHTKVEELLELPVPLDLLLSIKSSVITVKYFVHVTLDIPMAFDLHCNLPIILTSKKVIDCQLAEPKFALCEPPLVAP